MSTIPELTKHARELMHKAVVNVCSHAERQFCAPDSTPDLTSRGRHRAFNLASVGQRPTRATTRAMASRSESKHT